MVPKIADFCLSRVIAEGQSQTLTEKAIGTLGYVAPELMRYRVVSYKSDIYSLGVVMTEILNGQRRYFPNENVLESWRTRMGTSLTDILLEQVRVCTEISIACINPEPECRPDMQRIIKMLDETKCEEPAEQ